ncbi:MAG TPA: hypothetical protein VJL59_03935 [Anaerolineales bacterium]|nr:hypothetical protein [Anaerolineales bacterium]
MKRLSDFLQVVLGVAFLAVFALVLVVVFRAVSQGGVGGAPAATQPAQGYPPPQETVEIPATPSPLPPGYPPPVTSAVEATAWHSTQVAQSTALAATVAAEIIATSCAPTPTPQGALVGPQTIRDPGGHFSLTLLPGWYASAVGITVITNYDTEKISDVHTFPSGGLKIQIGVGKLESGQSFEQWLSNWIAVSISPPPDSGLPGLTATEPQPYILGNYEGVTYFINDEYRIMEIVLPVRDRRVIIIGLTPADSPALTEALSMLASLEVLP